MIAGKRRVVSEARIKLDVLGGRTLRSIVAVRILSIWSVDLLNTLTITIPLGSHMPQPQLQNAVTSIDKILAVQSIGFLFFFFYLQHQGHLKAPSPMCDHPVLALKPDKAWLRSPRVWDDGMLVRKLIHHRTPPQSLSLSLTASAVCW